MYFCKQITSQIPLVKRRTLEKNLEIITTEKESVKILPTVRGLMEMTGKTTDLDDFCFSVLFKVSSKSPARVAAFIRAVKRQNSMVGFMVQNFPMK